MPVVKIPPGVFRAETRNVVPGRWHEANLIRWKTGIMSPIGGHDRITKAPLGSIPRNIYVWLDEIGNRHSATLCDDALFVEINNDWVEKTPLDYVSASSSAAQGYGSGDYGIMNYGSDEEPRGAGPGAFDVSKPIRHSMDNWNSELLFSSTADGRLWVYNPTTKETPVVAENAPGFISAFIVTEEHHVMTFGTDGLPNRVAWSDQDNRTGWDYTNVTGQAGFRDLEGAGHILSAAKIPGGILIFTSTSVWMGRYIGQPYYYGFTKLAEGCAPISAHSMAIAGSRAFWMGHKGFWKYEGGVVSPLLHTLGTDLFDQLAPISPRRVFAGYNGLYPEIWFFYPDGFLADDPTMVENTRYAVFNFEPGMEWWADGDLSRSVFVSSPIDNFPLAGSDQTHLYRHEQGWEGEGRGTVQASVSSISFGGGEQLTTVKQCQIDDALGVDAVAFDFKGRYDRGGEEYVFHENLRGRPDGYLDTHFAARDFSMTVKGVVDGPWGMGAMIFDVKPRGKR